MLQTRAELSNVSITFEKDLMMFRILNIDQFHSFRLF